MQIYTIYLSLTVNFNAFVPLCVKALTSKDISTNQPSCVPLVITYNPALRPLSSIIHKHFHILSSHRCANVFKATPLVAFRRTKNISNLLVRSKLHTTTPSNQPGSFCCGNNRCRTCNDGQTDYTFHSTGDAWTINHRINCNSRNGIYMVECRRCNKQYIGKTKRQLKECFNKHHRPVDKQVHPNNSKLTAVSEHFLSSNHSASDMQLIPLELIKSNHDDVHKAREAHLIDKGQTLEPKGLNRCNET